MENRTASPFTWLFFMDSGFYGVATSAFENYSAGKGEGCGYFEGCKDGNNAYNYYQADGP